MSDQIQPAPQPTMWSVDHTVDGNYVVVIKQTFGGTAVDFISIENATQFWQMVRDQTRICRRMQNGGRDEAIVVPPKVILGMDGNTLKVVSSPVVEDGPDDEPAWLTGAEADAAAEDAAVHEVLGDTE